MRNIIAVIIGIVGISSLIRLHNKYTEKKLAEHLQKLIHEQTDCL
jgi:uncharacterized membrane protein YuzA (DUF378 family)